MKNLFMMMLLLAIVACNNDEELLVVNNHVNGEEVITIKDSIDTKSIGPGNWDDIPDEWFDIYGEPMYGSINSSYTIISPVPGVGSVTIEFSISYYYSEPLIGPRVKALVEVGNVNITRVLRNTSKYLIWQDGGSLAGPINIQHSVANPIRYIDLRLFGTLSGEGGFFGENETTTNRFITYTTNFNINNY